MLLAAIAAFGLIAAGNAASASAALPAQGIFENCGIDSTPQTCVQRLNVMHAGGLQVVVIPAWGASLSGLSQYAAAAHGLGMSVMWELSDPDWWQQPESSNAASGQFSAFASACGCSDNASLLAFVVRWLSQQPATYGYYAADDSMIGPNDQAGIASYVARIKQSDGTRPVMIGAANAGQQRQYQSIADLSAQEFYPVSTSSLMPADANQATWSEIDSAATATQQTADAAHKQSAVILQAFTWGDNVADGSAIGVCSSADTTASCNAKLRYPSGAEQLALRNAILSNAHPQLILWFSFQGTYGYAQDPGSYFATPSPDEAAARWAGLSATIQSPWPASQPLATTARVRHTGRGAAKSKSHKHHKRGHAARHRKHRKHKLRKH